MVKYWFSFPEIEFGSVKIAFNQVTEQHAYHNHKRKQLCEITNKSHMCWLSEISIYLSDFAEAPFLDIGVLKHIKQGPI